MEYKIYKEDDFKTSNWTGGTTTQLGIFPSDSDYVKRDFIWRLSRAECNLEESNFSKLPDFDRVLVVLEGEAVLAHEDVRVARLNPLEQDRFDGGYKTKCFGKMKDYNLMVSKGNQGIVEVISLNAENQTLERENYPEYKLISECFYCPSGFATLNINGEILMLKEMEQLVINYEATEDVKIGIMGEGNVIRCEIFYSYEEGDLKATYIPREKATFDDFKMCMYLANTQFRGAKYIFKSLRSKWLDEELTKAINKVERIYLPYFIFLVGLMIMAFIGVNSFTNVMWIIALLIWLVIDIAVVSPLLYMAVVPKPVRKHIKDINNLTPYEEKVLEKQLATNERLERLLKKYKYTGKARYDEEGNRLDKTF